MPVAFNKFNYFVQDLGDMLHNLNSDTLKIMLVNSPAPDATANHVKTDLTEITAQHGYSAGGTSAAPTAYSVNPSTGLATLTGTTVVFTASLGSFGPFQYVVLYNDTATNKNLIGYWNYGSSISCNDGETFTVTIGTPGTVLTIQ